MTPKGPSHVPEVLDLSLLSQLSYVSQEFEVCILWKNGNDSLTMYLDKNFAAALISVLSIGSCIYKEHFERKGFDFEDQKSLLL